jgi:hypothetical protein
MSTLKFTGQPTQSNPIDVRGRSVDDAIAEALVFVYVDHCITTANNMVRNL